MKKFFYSLSLLLMAFIMPQSVNAQTEQSILFEAKFDADLCGFTEECAEGQNLWQFYDIYQCALAYGQDNVMRDTRLVSPEITLGTANTVSFYCNASAFEKINSEVSFSVREIGGEWTDFEIPGIENGTWATVTANIPAGFDSKKVQLAVRYNSNFGMLIVDDFTVKGAGAQVEKIDPALSFDETEIHYVLGEEFIAPYLNNEYDVPVTMSSSDETVAKIDECGEVIILNKGEVTITAESEETFEYSASKASYKIFVTIDENVARPLFFETLTQDLGEFTTTNDNVWGFNEYYSCASASTESAADGSLVSPAIELGKDNVMSFYYYAFGFTDVNSAISVSIREVDGEWSELQMPVLDESGWTKASFEVPAQFNDKVVQFAIRFNSADGNFNIYNFLVTGKKGDVSTAIEGVNAEVNNGNVVYDLQGRRVNNPAKGLFIVNGKKVIIR